MYAVSITTTAGQRRYLGRARLGSGLVWRRNRRRAATFDDPSTARQTARAQARGNVRVDTVTVHQLSARGHRWHAVGSYESVTRGHLPATGFQKAL